MRVEILGALLLIVLMYLVIPIGVCVAALAALGGAERFLPGAMRDRALARREHTAERH